MDLSVLPDILALGLLIGAYRPLVRRAGAHVDLWFIGWTFVLLQSTTQLFQGHGGLRTVLLKTIGWAALELCGLAFVIAANSGDQRRIPAFAVELGVPMLLQTFLAGLGSLSGPGAELALSGGAVARLSIARYAVNLLFAVPAVHLVFSRRARRGAMPVVAVGFAAFGLATLGVAAGHPVPVMFGVLCLIYLSAAYVCLRNTRSISKGVVTTVAGLAGWGLRYPFLLAMQHFYPQVHLDRGLMEVPQYMVVAGSILTLLEEHLVRTERMAMHDALTDLPNRRLFDERFALAMEEARLRKTTVACLVIDVDHFKTINDTLGHGVGDELLRALAIRLSWHMSSRDILARTGGDEFTAMLAGVTDEHHLRFIASAMMSAASVPIVADGRSIDVHISMGIALSPDDADDIKGLRAAADEAMYEAKRRGGNLLAFAGDRRPRATPLAAPELEAQPTGHILQMRPLGRHSGRVSRA